MVVVEAAVYAAPESVFRFRYWFCFRVKFAAAALTAVAKSACLRARPTHKHECARAHACMQAAESHMEGASLRPLKASKIIELWVCSSFCLA